MEKALFSITCTTCQARLAVRSEAAIGTILECPRCMSMVHIVPPEGWQPASPAAVAAAAAGPPPLDRVGDVALALETPAGGASLVGRLVQGHGLVLGVACVAALTTAGLAFSLLHGPTSGENVAAAVAGEPSNRVIAEESAATKEAPPGPQSGGVSESPSNLAAPGDTPASTKTSEAAPAPGAVDATASGGGKKASEAKETSPGAQPGGVLSSDSASQPGGTSVSGQTHETAPVSEPDDVAEIEIKKEPPAPVDVEARLRDPIAAVEFVDMPLVKAIDLLSAMGGLPVTIDGDALARLGVGPRDTVTVRLDKTTLGKAFETAVKQRGLSLLVEDGQVVVTSPAETRDALLKRRYTISDLTGDDAKAVAELAAMVERFVAPESWKRSGGRGAIEPDGGVLAVEQTGDVHWQVLVFCEKLRNASHKALRSRDNPQRFTLATRQEQAKTTLDRPVTANFHEPATLARILAFLAEAAECDILVDRASLAAIETSDRVEATLTVEKRPLRAALDELLPPLGLAYCVIGPKVVEVTTREAADERLELAFHPIGAWLAAGIKGPAAAEHLKGAVVPMTWAEAGGVGDVCFDAASGCLLVLQSQAVQEAVGRMLAVAPGAKGEGGRGKGE